MTFKFKKIYNKKIDIDIDKIISNIKKTVISENISGDVLKDDSGIPFWQTYKSNISFARNFYTGFHTECKIIADTLKDIQIDLHTIPDPSNILKLFLNSIIVPNKVNIIKIPCGVTVSPHIDSTRSICINIGLKNSNTAITHVSDYSVTDFWINPTETYQMEDGDMYLLNVKKTHAVKSIVSRDSNLARYIITYTLV